MHLQSAEFDYLLRSWPQILAHANQHSPCFKAVAQPIFYWENRHSQLSPWGERALKARSTQFFVSLAALRQVWPSGLKGIQACTPWKFVLGSQAARAGESCQSGVTTQVFLVLFLTCKLHGPAERGTHYKRGEKETRAQPWILAAHC